MKKRYRLTLFVFRRDLRVHDNTALIAACQESECVIPCFIFDDRQINQHDYFSEKAFSFMINSLFDLQQELQQHNGHLFFFKGSSENVIEQVITTLPIDAVFLNRDYTPFSQQRDEAIAEILKKNKRDFFALPDALLNEPEMIVKKDGSPYVVYTAFAKKSREFEIIKPKKCPDKNFYKKDIVIEDKKILKKYLEKNTVTVGGRVEGKKLLSQLSKLKNYEQDRNFPALNATSHLSAHHKFGTISIRESYHAIIDALGQSTLINELYWRDFFTHIAFHFPHVFSESFHSRFRRIRWSTNEDHFQKWCEGKTGFPIVDAGMRELNETGYMHNRVRMITASFLVKDLHIDWRWGERYFAQHLMDYDPSVNNGNWQWAASTGCDAQPYFRIFNPWLQQKRFDPEGDYIKRWLPELQKVSSADLHNLFKLKQKNSLYPAPMLEHSVESTVAKRLFQGVKKDDI